MQQTTFPTFVPGLRNQVKIDISCELYVKPYFFSEMKEAVTSVSMGPVVQLVMFPTTDLVVASLILARSHTLVEIDHEKNYGHSPPSTYSRRVVVSYK